MIFLIDRDSIKFIKKIEINNKTFNNKSEDNVKHAIRNIIFTIFINQIIIGSITKIIIFIKK